MHAFKDVIDADDVTAIVSAATHEELVMLATLTLEIMRKVMRRLELRIHVAKTQTVVLGAGLLLNGVFRQ